MTRPFRDGESCIICGTRERKHHARGLCVNCYAKTWRGDNPEKIKEIHKKHEESEKRKNWLEEYHQTDKYKQMMEKSSRKFRENNHDVVLERTRVWRQNNPEIIEAYKETAKNKKIFNKYGEDALRLIIECGYKCQKCGSGIRVAIHHIDLNKKNNVYENFAILCNSCHSILHNWKSPHLRKERFVEWMNTS